MFLQMRYFLIILALSISSCLFAQNHAMEKYKVNAVLINRLQLNDSTVKAIEKIVNDNNADISNLVSRKDLSPQMRKEKVRTFIESRTLLLQKVMTAQQYKLFVEKYQNARKVKVQEMSRKGPKKAAKIN